MSKFSLARICLPAKIYLGMAVLAILFGLFSGVKFSILLWKLIFAVFYTWILNWLCSKGFKSVSWFLVLLPYIIIFAVAFKLLTISKQHQAVLKNIGGQ
jgi:hypothetical protein